ncbi:MAG: Fic family protein [Muribaculaceae bacterium]|nr:Fic family protein [Muribaculaceae bacterium]
MKPIELNLQRIIDLCCKHKVKSLAVFGSILTDRFNDKSEVDLLVDFEDTAVEFAVAAADERQIVSQSAKYWKYLKTKLKAEGSELVSATNQLKLLAPDGKRRLTDTLDATGIAELAKKIHNDRASLFLDWLLYSENTVDGKSRKKAYELFNSTLTDSVEIGTTKGLQQIHSFLFGGLYDFAGQIRTKTISKGGFTFCLAQYLDNALLSIDKMPDNTLDDILNKYVEMNVAHPFMEGNGRSTRIWLDMLLKRRMKRCVDWSKIEKREYLKAMEESTSNATHIKTLIANALTDKIDDREMFMKGIDYSYYYEQRD